LATEVAKDLVPALVRSAGFEARAVVGMQMQSNLINIDGVGDSIVETEVDLSFRYSRVATTVIPEVTGLAPRRCEHLFHESSL
jgi:hypothetical protein